MPPGWRTILVGVLAALPMVLGLTWILQRPAGPLGRLVDLVTRELGPSLAGRSVSELALLAALAGLGEELLFRGVVQAGLARLVPVPLALLSASILFGLAHSVTSTYALVASLLGLYLGALFLVQGTLVVPIIAHALYDFAALLLVAERCAAAQRCAPPH